MKTPKKPVDPNVVVLHAFCPTCHAAVPVTGRSTYAQHLRAGRQSVVSYRYEPRPFRCESTAKPVAAGEVDRWLASAIEGALSHAARHDREETEARQKAAAALAEAAVAAASAAKSRARAERFRATPTRRQTSIVASIPAVPPEGPS